MQRSRTYLKTEVVPMRTTKNLLIGFFLLLTTDAAFGASAPLTCGATLKGKNTYNLSVDLDCSKATAPITVRDRAAVNLNSHYYAGQIVLDGRQAQLRNGTINPKPTIN